MPPRKERTVTTRRNTIAALAIAATTPAALAQPAVDAHYNVTHNFRFMPQGDVVEVAGAEFRHTWIKSFSVMGGVWSAQAINQDPGFDPFGTESFMQPSPGAGFPVAFNSGIVPGVPVQCVYNVFNIPPQGLSDTFCIILPHGPSFANACTDFTVASYTTTPPFDIQGSVSSSGAVHAVNAECYAYSAASVSARGGTMMANGTINWNTTLIESVDGQAGAVGAITDPVHFIATNVNDGTVVEAPLFTFDIDATSSGTYAWQAGLFETDIPDMTLTIDIPPTYVATGESGSLELIIDAGVVTTANATGIFSGLPPAPGTTVPLAFPLPTDFDLTYDLNLDPTQPWDVLADLSGGGGTLAVFACPADLDGNGLVDFADVSLFLTLFVEQSPLADYTADGAFDFADASAFISAFAQGCQPPQGGPG